ncbi:MAG TPA: hypothetical protein VFV67_10905 [Actinophytocola sp.]|uniref:hypothetical protein n=1 Tax=Actinophytocola sp. TaxID=1872138 RepID=UPI002DB8DBD9|nr:hypothetical protein [Actinophytocola sp.]HEU5471152.1 hypothetical protein [Actinophytocola sp.]
MPIRTNRGRAAVYRRLWGWPMRSPRHLIATVLIVFAAMLTIGLLMPRLLGSADQPAAGTAGAGSTAAAPATTGPAAPPTTTVPQTSLPTRISTPTQAPTPAPPAPKALEVATQWATAWVNHEGVSTEQWLEGLRAYTTEEQLAVMSSVDPRNIAATAVTGKAVATDSYTSSVDVNVPTNGGTVSILVIATPQGWRVAHYEQA